MQKIILVALLSLTTVFSFAQNDVKGSQDHELINRYTGSRIASYHTSNYVSYPKYDIDFNEKGKIEGQLTSIKYEAPEGRSQLEVQRNYEQALQKAGFKQQDKCTVECQLFYAKEWIGKDIGKYPDNHYLEFGIDQGLCSTWVKGGAYGVVFSAEYSDRVYTMVDIATTNAMEGDMVDVNSIKTSLDTEGKLAIYGISFETGSATIQSSSHAVLGEIVSYLNSSSNVKLYVVGHTDNVGGFDSNMSLSEKRANAVVSYLVDKGISSSRLKAVGVGPAAPVASNKTDKGRAKNRRVELVLNTK